MPRPLFDDAFLNNFLKDYSPEDRELIGIAPVLLLQCIVPKIGLHFVASIMRI